MSNGALRGYGPPSVPIRRTSASALIQGGLDPSPEMITQNPVKGFADRKQWILRGLLQAIGFD
jgi:hypothetical protein